MLKLYADESVDAATSLMNLSGYIMTEEQFCALDQAVQDARDGLPYFHMKEAHHRKYPEIYQELVNLINPKSVLCGISVSFFLNEFNKLTSLKTSDQSLKYWFGGSCTFATGTMMALCATWLNESVRDDEPVAYVFENSPLQGDANMFWGKLNEPQFQKLKEKYHYASHTFVDGKGPLGSVLQLCDILAWNLNKMQREKKKSPELNRLFYTRTIYKHHGPKEIAEAMHNALDYSDNFDKKGRPRKHDGTV